MQRLSQRTREKARFLAEDGRVVSLGDGTWAVESSNVCQGSYLVQRDGYRYSCECKSYRYRLDCSHVQAVALLEGDDPFEAFEREGGDDGDPWQRIR